MFVIFIATVKFELPWFGSWSKRTLLFSPSLVKRCISKSSVMVTGTSLHPGSDNALLQERSWAWPAGTKLTSSKAIPSSTNSRSFQSTLPLWAIPSRIPSRVSMSAIHLGPMERTASLSSVDIQSSAPPGTPSNNPSRLSRTTADLLPFTHACASMAPVAQSSLISRLKSAKSYSKRSSKV